MGVRARRGRFEPGVCVCGWGGGAAAYTAGEGLTGDRTLQSACGRVIQGREVMIGAVMWW